MNREQRRNMNKIGGELKYLKTPCTIAEAAQIARGVAEDVVSDYNENTRPLNISMSLQVELIKRVLIEKGLITEEEFRDMYMKEAEEFTKMQNDMIASMQQEQEDAHIENPIMSAQSGDIEVNIEG